MNRAKIVPSVLPADLARLGENCAALDAAGVDRIQWDVMDGRFVPNLTFGPDVIAACRPHATCGFEAHLMCERPEHMLSAYVEAGCELVIVHPEALQQPHRTYGAIRELGVRSGVALSPASGLGTVEHVLDQIDLLLIMTVNPGFGGQAYLPSMEPKIAAARAMIEASGHDIELEVDGGIGPDTIAGAAASGADVFVSGSALWRYPSYAEGVADLRRRAEAARPASRDVPGRRSPG
ncbi:MAG: ribulose-phosphate 3-epimerase [Actinomycetota bacterium]|nr:ribulose-phosphate 3-epimerase [Euzebyales bacterium]MDQ3029129.1 ribulose-phosphate 3-epimerase [Actinomycetota bacterium]MDQ3342296.1 ribulose-phosphate 3-epimerase [Actinomycetota bacterium]